MYDINVSWGRFDDIFDGIQVGTKVADEISSSPEKALRGKSETTESQQEWDSISSGRNSINGELRNVPGYKTLTVLEPVEGKAMQLVVSALSLLALVYVI